nr:MAG TPA: hypothetical protein [Caudoviricetes sp.]
MTSSIGQITYLCSRFETAGKHGFFPNFYKCL